MQHAPSRAAARTSTRALLVLFASSLVAACDPHQPADFPDGGLDLDASTELDGGTPADAAIEEPLLDLDGTSRLGPCATEPGASKCASAPDWQRGRWSFHFVCPATSIWRVDVTSAQPSTLRVFGASGTTFGRTSLHTTHTITFTSREPDGHCTAAVELPSAGAFDIAIVEIEPALDLVGCDRLCLSDSRAGEARGCDCSRTCHNACLNRGVDCGLPCNRDVPGYACPFFEADIIANDDCTYYEADDGSFEHFGNCYRCGDGQQCCYTDGHDNGSGSYDLCPPLDPGPNDPDPNGCSGIFDHCDCDVVPLCGCMAESGDLELCGECIGEGNFDLASCNAPGDDGTFCQRALAATLTGWSWCAIVGDIDRCFDLPPGF